MPKFSPNKKLALQMAALAFGMICLVYAMFPLYSLFCKVTGYAGTPKQQIAKSALIGKKEITIRFNADVDAGLNWSFYPVEKQVKIKTGENRVIYYEAVNNSDKEITGVATFNVIPEQVATYFNKIQCFCFDKQTLKPKQKVKMPVYFFIDPKIEQDKHYSNVDTITLSYTFFEAK